MPYFERLLGLTKLATIYAYCREIAAMNDFFMGCEKEYQYETHGHNFVRALYMTGLVDASLWHDWNNGAYSFYKHEGMPDPNEADLTLAICRVAAHFEAYKSYAEDYSQGILWERPVQVF